MCNVNQTSGEKVFEGKITPHIFVGKENIPFSLGRSFIVLLGCGKVQICPQEFWI
jgi:hypothetical protein